MAGGVKQSAGMDLQRPIRHWLGRGQPRALSTGRPRRGTHRPRRRAPQPVSRPQAPAIGITNASAGSYGSMFRPRPVSAWAIHRGRIEGATLRGAGGVAVRAAVADLTIAAVVTGSDSTAAHPTEDDALTQRSTFPHRPGPLLGVVRGELRLDDQVLLPRQVALVVVLDQHGPLLPGALAAGGAHAAVRLHPAHVTGLTEGVHARVGRVLQHLQHPGVGQLAPLEFPGPRPTPSALREQPARLGEGPHHAQRGAGAVKLGEQISDRGLDLLVRVLDDVVTPRSASTTTICSASQPSSAAVPARPYCRLVDSVLNRTCATVDCRTYSLNLKFAAFHRIFRVVGGGLRVPGRCRSLGPGW